MTNVWNSSRDSKVTCEFDSEQKFDAKRNTSIGDPYAQRLQAYVFRYAMGFRMFGISQFGPAAPQPEDAGNIVQNSGNFHLWTCHVPTNLGTGVHDVGVSTTDVHGNSSSQRMVFEVAQ